MVGWKTIVKNLDFKQNKTDFDFNIVRIEI